MQKITPNLWFNNNAEEAVNFYTSVFKNSKIGNTLYYTEVGPGKPGTPMTITFELDGQQFVAINAGPEFTFTPAISLEVHCDTQEEVDYLWEKLSADPAKEQCGWLEDKYGVSWQIVPTVLIQMLLQNASPAKTQNVTKAMFQMKKLDIKALQEAYDK